MVYLCFPSFQLHRTVHSENPTGSSTGNCDSSPLANAALVHLAFTNDHTYASHSSQEIQFIAKPSCSRESSSNKTNDIDCMSSIRKGFREQKLSERTINIIMQSWRSSTKKQYKTYINSWFSYCHKRKISAVRASVEVGLDFLSELSELFRANSIPT